MAITIAATAAALPIGILEMIPTIARISPVSNWPSHKTRQAREKREHAGSDLFDEDKHWSYLDKIDISFDQTCWWILRSMKECSPMAEDDDEFYLLIVSSFSVQRNHYAADYQNSTINSRPSYSSPPSTLGLRREHSYRSSRDYQPVEPARYSSDYHFYPSIKRSRSRYETDDELRPAKRR